MPFSPFVPLRVLSSYSMLEGAIDPKALAKLAKERGFPAVAICDRNGLYGTTAFASACKGEGVQPIIGTLLGVARAEDGPVDYLPLLAQDEDGRWYWYRTQPQVGVGGGVWRSNSRNQQYAGQGLPNPAWHASLRHRQQ